MLAFLIVLAAALCGSVLAVLVIVKTAKKYFNDVNYIEELKRMENDEYDYGHNVEYGGEEDGE